MKTISKKYISNVKKSLHSNCKDCRKLIRTLKNEVEIYVSENHDANMHDLISSFGSPDEISDSYYSNLKPSEIKKQKQIKRYILICTICVIMVISIVTAIYSYHLHQLAKELISHTAGTI